MMEHRIILGGEQYLPFARSRIKALRATGLKYATQSFEIDGATVRVRIEGNHDHIYLRSPPTLRPARVTSSGCPRTGKT